MNDIRLEGCRPSPLVHYLKALGILRLVSEQADPTASGFWDGDVFVLRTALSERELLDFFLNRYQPTPVVSPWNMDSGLSKEVKPLEVQQLRNSTSERLETYRETIGIVESCLNELGIREKPDKIQKPLLLRLLRTRLPDAALPWLDAAAILTGEDIQYPPLLVTGGNDGRLDYSLNFIRRVCDVIAPDGSPQRQSDGWLRNALFGVTTNGLAAVAIGLFQPGAVGGPNSSAYADSKAVTNPWDFLLNFEGAVCFTASMARRFGTTGPSVMSAPFTFHPISAGTGSVARTGDEDAKGEFWVPLWSKPALAPEVQNLMSEGRVQLKGSPASDALDVVRAIASLGVDRGIHAFQRYAILKRNGDNFLAAPLGRLEVRHQPHTDLVMEIDGWLRRFRSRTRGNRSPASILRAVRRLEDAVWTLCEFGRPEDVLRLMLALSNANQALAASLRWATGETVRMPPVPLLSSAWLEALNVGGVEARLAMSLASLSGFYTRSGENSSRTVRIRENVLPIIRRSWDTGAARDVVWSVGDVVTSMNRVLLRRLLWRGESDAYGDRAVVNSSLVDIAQFIAGPFDDRIFEELFHAFCLLDWAKIGGVKGGEGAPQEELPDGLYTMLKLAFPGRNVGESGVVANPQILRLAHAGDGYRASQLAARRIRGSVGAPKIREIGVTGAHVQRSAAALLFPLSHYSVQQLAARLLLTEDLANEKVG